jgi:hypothetical protein
VYLDKVNKVSFVVSSSYLGFIAIEYRELPKGRIANDFSSRTVECFVQFHFLPKFEEAPQYVLRTLKVFIFNIEVISNAAGKASFQFFCCSLGIALGREDGSDDHQADRGESRMGLSLVEDIH